MTWTNGRAGGSEGELGVGKKKQPKNPAVQIDLTESGRMGKVEQRQVWEQS